jgi:Tfp pilus assembly protein PilV
MRVASTGKFHRGVSIIEILIAFAVLTLTLSAVILLVYGNQSLAIDTQTNIEALAKAESELEKVRAVGHADFANAMTVPTHSWTPPGGLTYTASTTVFDLSQCKKQATSTVSWHQGSRELSVELTTLLSDIEGYLALGGECEVDPPTGGWNPPILFASDNLSSGKFNTLDVLKKIVYLGADQKPFLYIADTSSTVLGDDHNTNPSIIGFDNSFNSGGKVLSEIYDIDAHKDLSTGKTYAFVATASTTAQVVVLDVSDISNPVIAQNASSVLAKRDLDTVTATDSTAFGWRLYFDAEERRLYVVARETAGPELHIFDMSDFTNPQEIGHYELNTTVNDLVVRKGLLYVAAESDARGEVLVFNVEDASSISELAGARTNLPGNEDGLSLYQVGNRLYFGRQEASAGPEFYIFDISDPAAAVGGLPRWGQTDPNKEFGTDIAAIAVAGQIAFMAAPSDASHGLKILNIYDPARTKVINLTFNFGNKPKALDFEGDFLYAGGLSNPRFQILYSAP